MRLRSEMAATQSAAELGMKLKTIVLRHQQMKTAFNDLQSQIKFGLLEAEEVFASLATPLMKLVGLKTVEMAHEGRFSTVINLDNHSRSESSNHIPKLEEQGYAAKAAMAAGKQVLEKQRVQFVQLVHLLKRIELQVNSRRSHILQTLSDHNESLHGFFQRAISFLSTVHFANHDAFYGITLKLLVAAFKNVAAVLGSVESGVEELMQELAENMCDPMVEYAKGLKNDMRNGTFVRLLDLVEEMERAMRDGRIELEEARNKERDAQKMKVEALSRLIESEERVKKMKECLAFNIAESNKASMELPAAHKLFGMEEGRAKCEKQLWELLKRKRKYETPKSPMGPRELLFCEANKKAHKSTILVKPSVSHRVATRSHSRRLGPHPQTPELRYGIPLGSSPSVTNQQVVTSKHISDQSPS